MRVSMLANWSTTNLVAEVGLVNSGSPSYGSALRLSQGGKYRVHFAS